MFEIAIGPWSNIARYNPKFFKIINQEYIQATDIVNFPLYIGPCKQRVLYEITVV